MSVFQCPGSCFGGADSLWDQERLDTVQDLHKACPILPVDVSPGPGTTGL